MTSSEIASTPNEQDAVRRLAQREEVLEICFWFQGEGFGERFSAASIGKFLNLSEDKIREALECLAEEGAFEREEAGYRFSTEGKTRASRLFHDTFADFQVGTHGECTAGCCDSEDHEDDHAAVQGEGSSSRG
jgi:hypothetical protein